MTRRPKAGLSDPAARPPPQMDALIAALARHQVRWVMWGSQVLALHGAALEPNDLDIVPDLEAGNLERLASCLDWLGAVMAHTRGADLPEGSLEACRTWRPSPPTPENLDWLFVTGLGMLDVVIRNAAPCAELAAGASRELAGGVEYLACDPRLVLRDLEVRGYRRRKDRERRDAYDALRSRLGM